MNTATAASLTRNPARTDYDPLKDKSYRATRLGPHVAAWIVWLELGEYAVESVDGYERTMSRFAKMYPTLTLDEVDDSHLSHFLRSVPAGSRALRKRHLNAFFNWAIKTRRVSFNPVWMLPAIREQKRKHIDIFTDAEMADLLALPIIDAALMALLFGAGLRRGEALKLQVRRVRLDPAPAHVVILGGKGGKDRIVQLEAGMADYVRELLMFHPLEPQDRLWYSKPGGGPRIERGRDIPRSTFERWWKRCLDDAGVRHRNPHVARHTFATRWLRRNGRLETLSGQMGHASIKTTYDAYAHLDVRDVLADLAVIEAAEKGPE